MGIKATSLALLGLLAFSLSGCAGRLTQAVPFTSVAPRMAASPDVSSTLVYACSSTSGQCLWYPLHSRLISGTIGGVGQAGGLGSDSLGNFYVVSTSDEGVIVYPKGSPTESAFLTDAGEFPIDIAIALDGTVFVANEENTDFGPGTVSVYKGGALRRIISDPNFHVVTSLAVDEHHLLIVCYFGNENNAGCDEFPNAQGTGQTVISGLSSPGGVKFDKNENIVLVDRNSKSALVYPPSGGTPCNSISLKGSPYFIALDRPQTHLFYADTTNDDIVQLSYPGCTGAASVVFTYNTGWTPTSVTVDLGPNP